MLSRSGITQKPEHIDIAVTLLLEEKRFYEASKLEEERGDLKKSKRYLMMHLRRQEAALNSGGVLEHKAFMAEQRGELEKAFLLYRSQIVAFEKAGRLEEAGKIYLHLGEEETGRSLLQLSRLLGLG